MCLSRKGEADDDDDIEDIDDYDCDYDDYEGDDHENTTVSFDSLLDLNCERRLGCDVSVCVSPSTITVRKISDISSENDEVLFECRIRYLSFMGISNDVR